MLIQANAFEIPLTDGSVHCCVTSPPYWGLRKYAGVQGEEPLGLEATPERHVERIVLIMREVRRVLRDDGVVWLNYGDCYATSQNGRSAADTKALGKDDRTFRDKPFNTSDFIAAGSLMLMPHRVAIALQDDGWIVRNDTVWNKPNPMPESVAGWRWERERKIVHDETRGRTKYKSEAYGDAPQRDPDGDSPTGFAQPEYEYGDDLIIRKSSWRHTRAHEYVFQLVKGMQYWSNQEAVREDSQANQESRRRETYGRYDAGSAKLKGGDGYKPDYLNVQDGNYRSGRNPRSVMEVPTAPYKGAHYATFPPNLIAPLIRASCPRWACPVCGQGWAPVVERQHVPDREGRKQKFYTERLDRAHGKDGRGKENLQSNVIAFLPTCEHEHTKAEAVPGIVFDPFVGSGTTVMVAKELLRRGIGMDISRPYLDDQARIRVGMGGGKVSDLPLFGG